MTPTASATAQLHFANFRTRKSAPLYPSTNSSLICHEHLEHLRIFRSKTRFQCRWVPCPAAANVRSFAPTLSPPLGMFGKGAPRSPVSHSSALFAPAESRRVQKHEHLRIIRSKTRFLQWCRSPPAFPRIANLSIRIDVFPRCQCPHPSTRSRKTGASSRVLLKITSLRPFGIPLQRPANSSPITQHSSLMSHEHLEHLEHLHIFRSKTRFLCPASPHLGPRISRFAETYFIAAIVPTLSTRSRKTGASSRVLH